MILELIMLYVLVSISPVNAEKDTVRSSGIDVAIPAIYPIVLGLKLSCELIFLKIFTRAYLAIKTIKIE